MIDIKTLEIAGFSPALHGMRNPKNSWKRADTVSNSLFESGVVIGENDYILALNLSSAGPVHAKYRRMITVYADIIAPLYWWKEFDTYKVGTVANSCSTMHKIQEKEFTLDDFSCEHLYGTAQNELYHTIELLNVYRDLYERNGHVKDDWWQMIQLLPSSYNQKRTVMMNYEVLANICEQRFGHKLDEWRDFIHWAENLPYSDLFLVRK